MTDNKKKHVEIELDYRWQNPDMSTLIRVIKIHFVPFVGEAFQFNGRIEQEGPPKINYRFDSIGEWDASLASAASSIHLRLHSSDYNKNVSMTVYPGKMELRVRIEAPYQELAEIKKLSRKFEEAMLLKPEPYEAAPKNLPVSTGKYIAKHRLDSEWLGSALRAIQKHFEKEIFFNGQFELRNGEKLDISGDDIASWINDVISAWDNLVEIYCWMYNPTRQITFQCDTRREIIELTVQSSTQVEIATIEKQLVTDLHLEIIPTGDPYQYRGIQGQYEILDFRNKKFGEALQLAVQQFVGPRPVVMEAYVESEIEVEKVTSRPLTNFPDFDSFLKRVEEDAPYIRAGLNVQGPRGASLGVYVEDQRERLVINSDVSANEYPQLVKIFKNYLTLKWIDRSEEDEGTEQAKKTFANSVWFKAVFPVVALILGAVLSFVLTPTFLGATAPVYALQITLPSHRSDEPFTITTDGPAQKLDLEWRLETTQLFRTVTNLDTPATIRVFRDGAVEVMRIEDQKPGAEIELSPGKYVIEVFSRETAASDRFQVIVVEPNP